MRIINAESFGKAIRARRKELHYTQGFLAEFSGLSVSFISDLENTRPGRRAAAAAADAHAGHRIEKSERDPGKL